MFVSNLQYCDFVVWTTQELVVNHIPRDEELLHKDLPKKKQCIVSFILPEHLTHSQGPALQPPVVCNTCENPEFGKMIV